LHYCVCVVLWQIKLSLSLGLGHVTLLRAERCRVAPRLALPQISSIVFTLLTFGNPTSGMYIISKHAQQAISLTASTITITAVILQPAASTPLTGGSRMLPGKSWGSKKSKLRGFFWWRIIGSSRNVENLLPCARCVFRTLNTSKCVCGQGSAPGPARGAYSAPP